MEKPDREAGCLQQFCRRPLAGRDNFLSRKARKEF